MGHRFARVHPTQVAPSPGAGRCALRRHLYAAIDCGLDPAEERALAHRQLTVDLDGLARPVLDPRASN